MAQPFVGEITIFAGNFAPAGWMFCEGQLLPVSENETLFELIGTIYGGDGQSTFALPDLRGRVPVHMGNNNGVNYIIGEVGGYETITLGATQIPTHAHGYVVENKPYALAESSEKGTLSSPLSAYPAIVPGNKWYGKTKSAVATDFTGNIYSGNVKSVGGSQPHTNMQPYLCVNFIICLFGLSPVPE